MARLKKADKVDFVATEKQFFDHLKDLWLELPQYLKGDFYVHHNIKKYANDNKVETKDILLKRHASIVVVASYGDLKKVRNIAPGSKVILSEHGAGQSYADVNHNSYIGAVDRSGCIAVLLPGETHIKKHALAHPTIPAYPVGCSKLDKYINDLDNLNAQPDKETIAISFHWDCRVTQETRSLFNFYKRPIQDLAKDYKLIGHGHPRDWHKFERFWKQIGVEPVKDFDEVIERAWVYAIDNSSTLFEWAALDRPVVVLNGSIYRRNVEHGLRFWEFSDIGVNCDKPKDLSQAFDQALKDPIKIKKRRKTAIKQIYNNLGSATEAAVQAIEEIANDWRGRV